MPTALASAQAIPSRTLDRSFFTAAVVANALIIGAGFGFATYMRLRGTAPFPLPALTPLVLVHAALSAAWTLLLVVQTRLIAASSVRLHRRSGIAGGLIAAAVVGLGWMVAVSATRRALAVDEATGTMALRFSILPIQELVVFTTLVGAALWLRKRGDYHKRLMLIGTLALIPAATTRLFLSGLPGILMMFGLAEALFLLALVAHDRRTLGRVHTATGWGGGLLLVTAVSRTLVMGTDAWVEIAKALIG